MVGAALLAAAAPALAEAPTASLIGPALNVSNVERALKEQLGLGVPTLRRVE